MRTSTKIFALAAGLALALPVAVVLAAPAKGGKGKAGAPVDTKSRAPMTITAGKGRLGVSLVEIGPELRVHLSAPRDRGVLVNSVRPDSPAARAGVAVGDVLVEVDGEPVDSAAQVLRAMSDRKKGDAIGLVLVRSGKSTSLQARLEDDPGPAVMDMQPDAWRDLGKRFEFGPRADAGLRRDLERAQKRIEELERRIEKLERGR